MFLSKEFDEYKRFENYWFRKSLGGMPDFFITSRLAMNMTVGGTDNPRVRPLSNDAGET
jgi:hypothetical protein